MPPTPRRRTARRSVGALAAAAVLLLGACSSSSKHSSAAPTTGTGATTTTASVADTSAAAAAAEDSSKSGTVWLCRPGLAPNPCQSDLTTTVVNADGSMHVKTAQPATDPKVDCFYVYPTVSVQKAAIANLAIDPEETSVAIAQASRFSQVCHVYAPMYRQATITALVGGARAGHRDLSVGYRDVAAAWRDYLAHDNHGRGVILIGHSQGSFVLTQLIRNQIDGVPAVRRLLVSALLLGGNVTVPNGKDVGGSFQHVPVCGSTTQTGCVVAYSSFLGTPPANSLFGRSSPGQHVVCVNPAAPGSSTAQVLDPYYPVGLSLLGGIGLRKGDVQTPWVEYPQLVSGQCRSNASATWLQIRDIRGAGDERLRLRETLGPTWGLHLVDVNVAYGDLVALAQAEAQAWKP